MGQIWIFGDLTRPKIAYFWPKLGFGVARAAKNA